jgi:hypothetical protein
MRRFFAVMWLLSAGLRVEAGQAVPCESVGEAYRECRVGSSGKIQLDAERSEEKCREGISWGTRSEGVVWVNRGCRGLFSVQALPGSRFVCESQHDRQTICEADTSLGVAVLRQLSQAACIEGDTWGSSPDGIWVSAGCRAEFVIGRAPARRTTEVLDRSVTCSSDGDRTVCPANTAGGVQLVRQLSDGDCGYRSEWGYDESGIWVSKGCSAEFVVRGDAKPLAQALICESRSARRNCEADTKYGVALVRQIGDKDCVLDRTWGFDDSGVWVTEGCHAQFALGGFRLPSAAVPPAATMLVCESADGSRKECRVGSLRGAGLVRQIGDADCILNRTWGYDREGVWVTKGCRAEFAVLK